MQKEGSFPGTGAGTPLGEALPRQTGGKRLPPSIPRQSWGNELKSRGTSLQITNPEQNKTRWRPLELLRVLMLHPSRVHPGSESLAGNTTLEALPRLL